MTAFLIEEVGWGGDEVGIDAALARIAERHPEIRNAKKEPTEKWLWLDGGGMVSEAETKVEFVANEVKFGIYVRQIPFFLDHLTAIKESEKFPGCVVFGGWMQTYIVSIATKNAMVKRLSELAVEYHVRMRTEEDAIAKAAASSPHVVRKALCACHSGKLYEECCGL